MDNIDKRILRPTYIKKFNCIGGECEDTCCAGWDIHIDEESYKKYKKINQYPIKRKVEKYISRKRSNPTVYHFAHMKRIEDKCAFLTEKGLCEIHRDLGEEYLCLTCLTYPRIKNWVDDHIEESLQLSCPEAARMVLLNEESMSFEYEIEQIGEKFVSNKVIKPQQQDIATMGHYFERIRAFMIEVVQERKYTLEGRLLILGLFFYDLEDLVEKEKCRQFRCL